MELNSIDQQRSMIMMGVNATNSIDQNYRLFDKINAVSHRNMRAKKDMKT